MTSIVELFPKARRLAYDLQTQVRQVELGNVSPDNVYMGLSELERQLHILENLMAQERPQQRDSWRRKILDLNKEVDFLKGFLDRCVKSRTKLQREAAEREELLSRRAETLPNVVVDQYVEEGLSYQRSTQMMSDIMMSGQASLASLIDQRSTLKNAQRKVLDIMNLLGLSNTIMRVAERRNTVDLWIVVIGMVVTLGVLYVTWKYIRGS